MCLCKLVKYQKRNQAPNCVITFVDCLLATSQLVVDQTS